MLKPYDIMAIITLAIVSIIVFFEIDIVISTLGFVLVFALQMIVRFKWPNKATIPFYIYMILTLVCIIKGCYIIFRFALFDMAIGDPGSSIWY